MWEFLCTIVHRFCNYTDMANVTYLIGAGASAGKRVKTNGQIIEGLPCVKEIPRRLNNLAGDFRSNVNNFGGADRSEMERLVSTINALYEASKRHSTIDTYAKKLFLRGEKKSFELTEAYLAFYFIIEQILLKPDSRYDTFLANILDNKLNIPDNINIISWNYDSQFEIAYREYSQNKQLPIASKMAWGQNDNPKILKVNGTAAFENLRDVPTLRANYPSLSSSSFGRGEDYIDVNRMRYILDLFRKLQKDETGKTQLSFAFDGECNELLYKTVDKIVGATDVLVVVGYTFPFFNREIDRRLMNKLDNLRTKIYIQDLYPERIKQSIKAVLPDFNEANFVLLNDVDQFFLPPEL